MALRQASAELTAPLEATAGIDRAGAALMVSIPRARRG